MNYQVIDSPIGKLRMLSDSHSLCRIEFEGSDPAPAQAKSDPILESASSQLHEYFSGSRKEFDIPLDAAGTDFQHQVWACLQCIPYGELRSYSDIARELKRPKAVRAVGAANGRNPIPIVVPCHRVIGSNGSLTGFAGGLPIKQQLLELEGAIARSLPL